MKELTCLHCSKKFISKYYEWHRVNGRKKYCSRKCSQDHQSLLGNTEITCVICGKKRMVVNSQLSRASYCSRKCHDNSQIGSKGYWFGKKRTLEQMGNAVKTMFKNGQMSGSNNPSWKGGITQTNWSERHLWKYQVWRKEVIKRDNYQCIWCESKENLTVDHIKPFSKYPELRTNIDNGRTLCRSCHLKTPTWGGKVHKTLSLEVMPYA